MTTATSKDSHHMFFEGPEKTLEVWFREAKNHSGKTLRDVPQARWVPMLDLVNCKILSSVSNSYCNAYLLSESSFFVYDSMVILKTCGTTTLLCGMELLLQIAKEFGFESVENVFYSRQNFFFPAHQLEPHSSFKEETKCLVQQFGYGGSPLMLGNVSGNHYKFYNWEDISRPPSHLEDITFECLMTGLSEKRMKEYFYKREGGYQHHAGDESGISVLLKDLLCDEDFKDMKIDEFIFDPFGYSMNAIAGKHYYTIHVTPQDVCSYASFETNLKLDDYSLLTQRLTAIFEPSAFMTVIVDTPPGKDTLSRLPNPKMYVRNERCRYEFDNYAVSYCSYCTPAVAELKRESPSRSPRETPPASPMKDKFHKDVKDETVGTCTKDVKDEKDMIQEYKIQPADVPDKIPKDAEGLGCAIT